MANGRPCTICQDPRRGALDVELRRADRPGYAELADQFKGMDWQAVRRHHQRHVQSTGDVVTATLAPAGPRSTGDLLALGQRIEAMVSALLEEASSSGSFKDAAGMLRVALESHAKLTAAYANRTPEFDPLRDAVLTAVRDRLADALAGHPEARAAALVALRGPSCEAHE